MLQALKVTLWVLPNLLLKEFKTLEILYKKKKKECGVARTQWKQEHTFIYSKLCLFFCLELPTKCFKLENFGYSVLGMKNGEVSAGWNVNVGLLQFFASQNMLSHVSYSFKTVPPSFLWQL